MSETLADRRKRQFNLYKSSNQKIATRDDGWNSNIWNRYLRNRNYSEKDIIDIIENGSIEAQIDLSRCFFNKGGFYTQQVLYYSTLLKYVGILIPQVSKGLPLSTPYIQIKYENAMNLIERLNPSVLFPHITEKTLVDGTYYGVIQTNNKQSLAILDLPSMYCRTRFKDIDGNDVIELNMNYFNTIQDENARQYALNAYPEEISMYYEAWKKNQSRLSQWMIIPSEISVCFSFLNGRPYLLSILPAVLNYTETVNLEKERNLEEIRKIIVQKIPHNSSTNELVFEPDEALDMHEGTVEMLSGNKNLSVLTTYADVDAIVSKSSSETANNSVERMFTNIYGEAGISPQLFSSTGSTTLKSSIKKDISLMMRLANKYSLFVTNLINRLYANSNIKFKYEILPVGEQNLDDYVKTNKELASLGYSWLVPAIAQGFSQKDLINIKELENTYLNLQELLIPLSSSFTQSTKSDSEGGAPVKEQENKAAQTIANEESLDNTGGG